VDQVDVRTGLVVPGAPDAPEPSLERGRLYVVRFQVLNPSDVPVVLRPAIEFAPMSAPDGWIEVPAVNPIDGVPFYTSSNVRRGEDPGIDQIAIAALRLSGAWDPVAIPAPGAAHRGVNPGPELSLPSHTFTELSFTIRATADAPWLAAYQVRLTDGGQAISGSGIAMLTMRDAPPVVLSPGQRSGTAVGRPVPIYPLRAPAGSAIVPAKGAITTALGPPYTSPHTNYTLTTDACAACHSGHRGQAPMLLVRPAPQSTLCFTCHNGTGADANIAAQYSDPTVPANNPAVGAWYSHPATALSNHTSDRDGGEFQGVRNRHVACADCHQPHQADPSVAIQTTSGWTASGALMGAAGVAVAYGPLPSDPVAYTLQATSAYEYELCFKCHSGFTQLSPQTGAPSTWSLDKAVELNPANASYHPVEGAGKNQTPAMGASLSAAGTSPYKLWSFATGDTVRCVHCHGDSRLGNTADPPAAGDRLAPHAVQYKGLLLENLRDVDLKAPSAAYLAEDFALCYVCHAEAPFVDTGQSPTAYSNFSLHGFHTAGIASFGVPVGTTVDEDGAGRGIAICAECHFRTHSTAYPVDGQESNERLVNFAPNVRPYEGPDPTYAGKLEFNLGSQSCTLTCHGVNHEGWTY
jgi:predicted CXXCH cytochrome family protein